MADFYFDNDVPRRLADLLIRDGHRAISARDLNLTAASDAEHLLMAARRTEILISHNLDDYELLHDAWQRWGIEWSAWRPHSGIIIVPQGRRHSIEWTPEVTAVELLGLVTRVSDFSNQLLRRSASGWQLFAGPAWKPNFPQSSP